MNISINFKTGVDRAMGQHNASDLSKRAAVHYKVGNWVIVHYLDEYDDNEYPGEVTAVLENKIKVSVLHKSGGYFKWPKKKDEVHCSLESVVANDESINHCRQLGTVYCFIF